MIHQSAALGADLICGDGAAIGPFVVAGVEPLDLDPLVIGADATIRSHAVLYRGTQVGDRFHAGHGALIREHGSVGDDVSIGSHSVIEHHVGIADGVRVHSGCFIPEFSRLEAGCWIGPHVVVTNARYPNRLETKSDLEGVVVEARAVVGAASVLLPGVVIGEGSIVGAGAVVVRDVEPGAVVVGNPARVA